MQVQKVWRTVIIHSLMPNCQIPKYQNAKFGQDAWDDYLPDLEPIECDADKEKAMFKYLEFFAHCLRPRKLNLHTRISIIGSKRNWEETLSYFQRNPTNFLQWWIR